MSTAVNPGLVSIVIVTYNSRDTIEDCINSVLERSSGLPLELILIDNASADGTRHFLETLRDVKLVCNSDNLGFAAANNQGIRLTSGKYIVLLNPDTVVTDGWLTRTLSHLNAAPDIGAVGPRSNRTGELQLDVRADASYATLEEMQTYAKGVSQQFHGRAIEFHRLAGFCIALKAEAVERVGFLDESFGVGYYEDDDYCRRLVEAGYRLLIALDVFIYHIGGASFGGLMSGFSAKHMLINRQRYLSKWSGGQWYREPPQGTPLSTPAVSVLIATRDRPEILRHALASVLGQTFSNFEVLIINDGACDLGPMIEAHSDPRIRLLSSGQRGKSEALNQGLRAARGEFIAYLDDDDYFYAWHLETMVAALLNRPAYLLAYADSIEGWCVIADGEHRVTSIRPIVWEYDRALILRGNHIPNLAVVHRRKLSDVTGPYDTSLPIYEDWDMLRRFSAHTDFLHVPIVTSEWHRHTNLESRNRPDFSLEGSVDLLQRADAFIRTKPMAGVGGEQVQERVARARDWELSGRPEVAVGVYLAALELDSLAWDACLGAARAMGRLHWKRRRLELLRRAIASRPDLAETHMAKAKFILENRPKRPQVLEAKRSLELALLAGPGLRTNVAYRMLGRCYAKLGSRATARACREYANLMRSHGRLSGIIGLWRREGLFATLAYLSGTLQRLIRGILDSGRFPADA